MLFLLSVSRRLARFLLQPLFFSRLSKKKKRGAEAPRRKTHTFSCRDASSTNPRECEKKSAFLPK